MEKIVQKIGGHAGDRTGVAILNLNFPPKP